MMRILALSLITFLWIASVESKILLNKFVADCRHCLRIVQMFKRFFEAPQAAVPKAALSQLLFREIIIGECNAGEYERYVPNHTPQLCEAYYEQHSVSFIHLYLGLTTHPTASETCNEFVKYHFEKMSPECEDWMGENEDFAACNDSTKCEDSTAKCCPIEKLCGNGC